MGQAKDLETRSMSDIDNYVFDIAWVRQSVKPQKAALGGRERRMTNIAMIAAAEARAHCKDEPDIIERLKKAMKACRNHWMVTDETEQFRAAVAAAMLESNPEEKDRIERSARALNKVGAMLKALQAGVPVDIEAMAAEKQDEDTIPLNKLWHEVVDA